MLLKERPKTKKQPAFTLSSCGKLNLEQIVAGYGECSVNGCPCPGFADNPYYPELCSNCGHNYGAHW